MRTTSLTIVASGESPLGTGLFSPPIVYKLVANFSRFEISGRTASPVQGSKYPLHGRFEPYVYLMPSRQRRNLREARGFE